MKILAHRGLWNNPKEKNSKMAFRRSFKSGFGVEFDVRDCSGSLVISHDLPKGNEQSLEKFLQDYSNFGSNLPIAINIKSDGLQLLLKILLQKYSIQNYFLFDMSVPDALGFIKQDFQVFTRESEYEVPSFYEKAKGVWIDSFETDWINLEKIKEHLQNKKEICLVSPELHGRSFKQVWKKYRSFGLDILDKIMLCTDYPMQAREYFNE